MGKSTVCGDAGQHTRELPVSPSLGAVYALLGVYSGITEIRTEIPRKVRMQAH
jgi:hypothetical protein